MLLSLPVIAPGVPATIEFSPAGERHLRLVLAMSRLGMITDDDLASLRRTRMTTSAIRTLIERGWHRAIGGDYTYQMISAYARLLLPDAADEDFIGSDGTPLIGFAINASQPQWITIDKAFTAIESEAPGLGCAAIKVLDSALCHFGVPHTPSGAFDMAQNLYWMGEEDETLAIEENGEDCDMPTRAGLFQGVPEWAYKTYGEERLSITDDEFAAHVERLADADFSQIFDDNYRYYCEGGEEPPWIGCVSFEPSEQSISESLTVIRHTGSVLQALDKALIEIKEFSV